MEPGREANIQQADEADWPIRPRLKGGRRARSFSTVRSVQRDAPSSEGRAR